MPNDAKLGMVVGVGLVIAVAVVFFRKDTSAVSTPPEGTRAVTPGLKRPDVSPAPSLLPANRTNKTSNGHPAPGHLGEAAGTRHIVEEGDTLFRLAQRYYGDGDRFAELYAHNRKRLNTPDDLPPGTVLLIPELPASEEK